MLMPHDAAAAECCWCGDRSQPWNNAQARSGGGRSKRHIGPTTTPSLEAFRRETIRAERVHWSIMATGPVQLLWCRPTVALGMVIFGVAFNAPFIVVQRYNRGRLNRLLRRRSSTFAH